MYIEYDGQTKLDARAEYQQGEEQSRLREQLRTDYELQDFLLEQFEMDSYAEAITDMIQIIKDRINETQARIKTLYQKKLERGSNWFALDVEIKELKKELARMISETIEDFGGDEVYKKTKNKYIEDAIFNETPLTKEN